MTKFTQVFLFVILCRTVSEVGVLSIVWCVYLYCLVNEGNLFNLEAMQE